MRFIKFYISVFITTSTISVFANNDKLYDSNQAMDRHQLIKGLNKSTCEDGNQFIDGRSGNKIAKFSGNRNEYTITRYGDGSFSVMDLKECRSAEDTVINIEIFQFQDESVKVSSIIPERYVQKNENLTHGPFRVSVDTEALKMNCEKNKYSDCHKLGSIFANGFSNVAKDYKTAGKYYFKACEGGHFNSCRAASNAFLNTKNPDHRQTIEQAQSKACTNGDFRACEEKKFIGALLPKPTELQMNKKSATEVAQDLSSRLKSGEKVPDLIIHSAKDVKSDDGFEQKDIVKCNSALVNESVLIPTDLRLAPNLKDGNISGMKVIMISPGSEMSRYLSRGDIVHFIDTKAGQAVYGQYIVDRANCMKIQKQDGAVEFRKLK